jgi:G3E family GTPase
MPVRLWPDGQVNTLKLYSDYRTSMQAVHELYDIIEGPLWADGEDRVSKVVIIGRNLDEPTLLSSLLQACDLTSPR